MKFLKQCAPNGLDITEGSVIETDVLQQIFLGQDKPISHQVFKGAVCTPSTRNADMHELDYRFSFVWRYQSWEFGAQVTILALLHVGVDTA